MKSVFLYWLNKCIKIRVLYLLPTSVASRFVKPPLFHSLREQKNEIRYDVMRLFKIECRGEVLTDRIDSA